MYVYVCPFEQLARALTSGGQLTQNFVNFPCFSTGTVFALIVSVNPPPCLRELPRAFAETALLP